MTDFEIIEGFLLFEFLEQNGRCVLLLFFILFLAQLFEILYYFFIQNIFHIFLEGAI